MRKTYLILVFTLGLVGLPILQGCSAEQTRTVQQTTTRTDSNDPTTSDDPTTTTITTKTDTKSNPEHSDSVLGATANAVGTLIAAPFRLVGDAFEIVF